MFFPLRSRNSKLAKVTGTKDDENEKRDVPASAEEDPCLASRTLSRTFSLKSVWKENGSGFVASFEGINGIPTVPSKIRESNFFARNPSLFAFLCALDFEEDACNKVDSIREVSFLL